MADESPNSYKDPYWSTLASNIEQKLELPAGLLASIVVNGEKTNADQVSEAGAKTPFQIIPATRKAAITKYGIDPYLNDQNAAEVAGLLLKDSLDRNNNNPALAVAEYHGGTDRANWGPRTTAYVQRVTSGLPALTATPGATATPSTFDVANAMMAPKDSPLAGVVKAYQAGVMSPEDAKAFETEVNAGHVVLPTGVTLKTAAPAPNAPEVPAAVAQAYYSGRMTATDKRQLDAAVKAGTVALPAPADSQIPGTGATAPTPEENPSLLDRAKGAIEAGANVATGLVGGSLGMMGGLAGGVAGAVASGDLGTPAAQQRIDQAMAEGAQSLTYQPRTAQGQAQAAAVGEVLQQAIPVAPLGAEMAAVGHMAGPAAATIAPTARYALAATKDAATVAADAVKDTPVAPEAAAVAAPTPGTMGSVGSAAVDMATQRRMAAGELPVPLNLTKGMAERGFEQQQFEREIAKNPELGGPIRERTAALNQDILRNFDAWVDQTGATAPDLRATGAAVDKALIEQAKRDKTQIRVAYADAKAAGEMADPVALDPVAAVLNDSTSAEGLAPVLGAARKEIQRLGGAHTDANGVLVPSEMTLENAETLRKFVNGARNADPTNNMYAGKLISAIDQSTEDAGGSLYKQARALRAQYADRYENRAVIDKLMTTKNGSKDRQVAFEDVFNHSILRGSRDDVRQVRMVLMRAGEEGQQAWKELQGQTIKYLQDTATKNVARDIRGNPVVSAAALDRAVKALDADGKLNFIFGKKGAEQIRVLNDVAKDVYTSPPGSVNTSNTASILMAALDGGIIAGTGIPVPLMTGLRVISSKLKNRKLAARVREALGEN